MSDAMAVFGSMIIIIQIVGLEPMMMINHYHYVTAILPGSGPRSVHLSCDELTGPGLIVHYCAYYYHTLWCRDASEYCCC